MHWTIERFPEMDEATVYEAESGESGRIPLTFAGAFSALVEAARTQEQWLRDHGEAWMTLAAALAPFEGVQ